ncbi:uncharacterized protein LOC134199643 [Bombyx mori]|uniref:uncharacterized protein LOC134199643 n=1 Tax=Bombyx mori TaxID=7091 RepID=UPI002ED07A09
MNVKNDSKSLNELCVVCLCVGRSLRVITEDKILKYYLDALQEIPLNRVSSVLLVCWECEVLLKRAVQFRQQVQDSHRILQTYTKENLNEYLLTEVSRPPRLKITKNEIIAISPHVDCSRRPNVRVDFKDEVKNEVIQNFIGYVEREQEDALVNVRSVSKRKSKQWTRKKLKRNREKFSECFLNEVSYATSGTRNRKDLQSVLVKDEVKNEKSGSGEYSDVRFAPTNLSILLDGDSNASLEVIDLAKLCPCWGQC